MLATSVVRVVAGDCHDNLPSRSGHPCRRLFRRRLRRGTIAIAVAIKAATASAPAASTWATAAPSASRPAASGGFGARFIDFQGSPANFLAIQSLHGLGRFRIVGHLDKRKSSRSSSFPVHRNVNPSNLSERFKQGAQLRFRSLKIHVADKHVLHNVLSFKEWESAERAASLAGFRSLRGDNEHRMMSRRVDISLALEGEGKPDSHEQLNNYIRVWRHFRHNFPGRAKAIDFRAILLGICEGMRDRRRPPEKLAAFAEEREHADGTSAPTFRHSERSEESLLGLSA